jgi:hypothetical protein
LRCRSRAARSWSGSAGSARTSVRLSTPWPNENDLPRLSTEYPERRPSPIGTVILLAFPSSVISPGEPARFHASSSAGVAGRTLSGWLMNQLGCPAVMALHDSHRLRTTTTKSPLAARAWSNRQSIVRCTQ